VKTLLLDSHVVHWLADEPERLSAAAASAIERAEDLAVAAPTWFELAWLRSSGRLEGTVPLRAWLDRLAQGLRTMPIGPGVAARAAELPDSFPRDPADRIIFATAVEFGIPLVTRDTQMQEHAAASGGRLIW
jgi:PIN domain nuclease of toxin-antitoxin system